MVIISTDIFTVILKDVVQLKTHSPIYCNEDNWENGLNLRHITYIMYPRQTFYIFINTLRPRQNGCHFADDTFKRIFLKENVTILIKISLKFVPKSPIDNVPALFQIMAWRRPGDKPLSEAMMVSLLTHICVARPQWVNVYKQTNKNFGP